MSNQIERKPDNRGALDAGSNLRAIGEAVGSETLLKKVVRRMPSKDQERAEQLLALMMTEVHREPKLWLCDPESVQRAAIQVTILNMEPNRERGLLYLIPYSNKRDDGSYVTEMQVQIGYRGMIHQASRSGAVRKIEAVPVFAEDRFEDRRGTQNEIIHVPDYGGPRSNIDLRLVYAVATLPSGDHMHDVLTKAEIDAIRKRSKFGQGGPWASDYIEMARKTAIRRLFKYLPAFAELGTVLDQLEQEDRVEFVGASSMPELPGSGHERKTRADELTEELFEPAENPKPEPKRPRSDEPVVITPDDIPF